MDFLQTLRGAPDRTLYRVIAGRRPTKRDFQSDAELGREPRGDQLHDRRQYEGVSMFDRLQDAERVTRRFALGPAIAELVIAANSREITVHKTRGPHIQRRGRRRRAARAGRRGTPPPDSPYMTIQIWSMSTRNLIGEYRTEDQALRAIRRDIERLGKGCTRDLAMGDPPMAAVPSSAAPSLPRAPCDASRRSARPNALSKGVPISQRLVGGRWRNCFNTKAGC